MVRRRRWFDSSLGHHFMDMRNMGQWHLEFEAPRGKRLHRYFWCATLMGLHEVDLWWCDAENKFLSNDHPSLKLHSHGSHSKPVRTLKAFKRFLRNHPELQGRRVTLVNRYVGYNVEAEYR